MEIIVWHHMYPEYSLRMLMMSANARGWFNRTKNCDLELVPLD